MSREGFHPFRYFLWTTLVGVPVLTGAAALVTGYVYHQRFFREELTHAARIAESVHHHLATGLGITCREFNGAVENPVRRAETRDIVYHALHPFAVERVYIYSPDGRVIFSNVPGHVGRRVSSDNHHFHEALQGRVSGEIRRRGEEFDLTGAPAGGALLETYVPIFDEESGREDRVCTVIELYQDGSAVVASVRRTALWVLGASLLCMAIQAGLSYFIVRRADRTIRSREEDLISSNDALKELSRDLENQVRERTRLLLRQEKLAALGTISAGIAHEINNPLATVATCVAGSINRLESATPAEGEIDEVREYLSLINDEVFRCKRITENLLDFSRQGRASMHYALDLDELIRQTIELIHMGRNAKGTRIDLELGCGNRTVSGDATQIREVVFNLVTNALHATRESPEPRIMISSDVAGEWVTVDVVDNGSGVPEEARERVFEPFFTTKSPGKGTGLGLAVCHGIIESHRGSLQLVEGHARPPRAWRGEAGAWFRFTLPLGGDDDGADARAAQRLQHEETRPSATASVRKGTSESVNESGIGSGIGARSGSTTAGGKA